MPSSQTAATERRNDRVQLTHEPPKLKTTLKTPPKQATNPLQFVKVGPCSLYRTAQEQLQKVQEVKKIKQEVRDDPEDWQSNLDNWKSSRRKRQEHIIERVVEVKKLELEEHDRQRRRNKTFSEMMEERGNRGRKLSISLAMYNDEDANDLSDLGIGTSSGKSSVSGDTHDDTHSVLSDRDSEMEKSHSDVDNLTDAASSTMITTTTLTATATTVASTSAAVTSALAATSAATAAITTTETTTATATTTTTTTTTAAMPTVIATTTASATSTVMSNATRKAFGGFHNHNQEYDSATTATTSSPEPEEYTYEGAIRGYVSRVSQNIPRRSLTGIDSKLEGAKSSVNGSKTSLNDDSKSPLSVVKVDILKRREVFEKASQKSNDSKANNRLSGDFTGTKSIKERLSSLEKQKYETENCDKSGSKTLNRLSGDMSSIRERLTHLEKQASERESKSSVHRKLSTEDMETVRPLRERLSTLEKYSSSDESSVPTTTNESRHNGELSARTIKDRLSALDAARSKDSTDKRPAVDKHALCFRDQENRIDTSTPSERSSSPDSEYRVPRAIFHRSLDSLDADASSGPDTFERVQSLEELDYGRRYPASSSSAELLNDTDREDSGIHTADVSCSVSQADEPIDEEIVHISSIVERRETAAEERVKPTPVQEDTSTPSSTAVETPSEVATTTHQFASHREAVAVNKGTADISGELSTNKSQPQTHVETTTNSNTLRSHTSVPRAITHLCPKTSQRETTPENLSKARAFGKDVAELKAESEPSPTESIVSASLKLSIEQARSKFAGPAKRQNPSKEQFQSLPSSDISSAETYQLTFPTVRATTVPTSPSPESNSTSKPASARAASKIPTPLSRKTAKSSPTSSDSALTSSSGLSAGVLKASPSKSHPANCNKSSASPTACSLPRTSEAASFPACATVESSPVSSQASPTEQAASPSRIPSASARCHEEATLLPAATERRRTVVEVCEKVVVPQGKTPTTPPVTPFITVNRVNDKQSSELHYDSSPQERIVVEKADQEEATAIRPAASTVEHEQHEQHEKTETPMSVGLPATTRKCVADLDVHDASAVVAPTASPPDRPTSLSLAKQEVGPLDTSSVLSPASPISKQILPLTLSNDEEIIAGQPFLLSPLTSVEPPKEKPPPPPVDVSDDENPPPEPLKRLNSTRRIKKELRTRRSDFLGIEGVNDDDLEPVLTLTKPPDMAAILAEERRIEQLHRRSFDTDSNYEQDSSHERDSGVELGHVEDWTKQPVSPDMSQHSRQSSEPFGASVTSSEEDEITKKEREIIEVLEKEEQWRYGDNREFNSDLGERLAHKLRELEEEKMQLERERAQEVILRCNEDAFRKRDDNMRKQEDSSQEQQQQQHDETAKQRETQAARATEEEAKYTGDKRRDEELETMQSEQLRMQNEIEEKERKVADACRKEEMRIRTMESQIREQENKALVGDGLSSNEDEFPSGEVLRVERELLQLEQEELKRQRNNLAYREQKQLRLAEQLQEQWKSLQDVAQSSIKSTQQYKYHTPTVNYGSSMPNLQFQDTPRRRPPPPPIPLTKPRMLDQRQRDVTIRNSRIPSADSIPQQVDASIRESASATTLTSHAGQQMSRQTLQALSAVPRPRIVQGDQWVQRRKSDVPRGAHDLNYQHWLIQEAEHRRINERNQRSPARKSQPHVTGTSVPYNAPTRADTKPLPDSIIQTLTQRVQNKTQEKPLSTRRRSEHSQEHISTIQHQPSQYALPPQKTQHTPIASNGGNQEKMLSVSGKKKCSHCGEELGRGAAMIIESLRLFYHMECFKCCVCHVRLGDGLMGTDVRVRNHKLHCHNCYSSDDGTHILTLP
ncbi:platelet binding protein GspB isoform X3 [Odontomachus brunneus]|uniref:platelet binding protein GspB isoform X3 n=1 Tax=Odontomachus brunneus TaxID=486640 RepID=UPI0013F250BE|nr:platelet binding protein GspB isoform X3 [Odontomachus brunneus]